MEEGLKAQFELLVNAFQELKEGGDSAVCCAQLDALHDFVQPNSSVSATKWLTCVQTQTAAVHMFLLRSSIRKSDLSFSCYPTKAICIHAVPFQTFHDATNLLCAVASCCLNW